jgi:hypothetical protein
MDYVDPQGYWLDPDRNIHRMSIPDPDGEQTIIATITPECSQAEWDLLREALRIVCARRSIKFEEWSGHYPRNSV